MLAAGLPAGGVTLHAAGVGRRLQLAPGLARRAHPAFGPVWPDLNQMAAIAQGRKLSTDLLGKTWRLRQ